MPAWKLNLSPDQESNQVPPCILPTKYLPEALPLSRICSPPITDRYQLAEEKFLLSGGTVPCCARALVIDVHSTVNMTADAAAALMRPRVKSVLIVFKKAQI